MEVKVDLKSMKHENFKDNEYIEQLVKEQREKVGLKFNIQKTKTMASSPIT